jgi:succinyl-CoA synthetase beta subunit
MKIHEHQAKELLRSYGIPVPEGGPADTPWAAYEVARSLSTDVKVVKAQIHAGGRGKGGGVKIARSLDEVTGIAEKLLGMTLVTPQTGPEGRVVRRLLVEQGVEIGKELYLSILLDRARRAPLFMASAAGGMDIEEVAAKTPERIVLQPVDPIAGMSGFAARKVAYALKLDEKPTKQLVALLPKLYRLFVEKDCTLVEINPLVVTKTGDVLALDAKITFDDNALFRHKEIAALRDFTEEDPLEILASRYDIDYVKLDGEIGCMVNGAGLAMATMDIIKAAGAMPANFLDIKGGAKRENVVRAFGLLMSDPHVRAVLINIFGGIVKCDMVATGIREAMKDVEVKVPVVVRLEGTNAAEGRKILAEADFPFLTAEGLKDAADKVVAALATGRGGSR